MKPATKLTVALREYFPTNNPFFSLPSRRPGTNLDNGFAVTKQSGRPVVSGDRGQRYCCRVALYKRSDGSSHWCNRAPSSLAIDKWHFPFSDKFGHASVSYITTSTHINRVLSLIILISVLLAITFAPNLKELDRVE